MKRWGAVLVVAASSFGLPGHATAVTHPLITDPPGDVAILNPCVSIVCVKDVAVDQPALDIVWGDVSTTSSGLMARIGVVDIDSPTVTPAEAGADVRERSYQTSLEFSHGTFELEVVVDAATGAVGGRGRFVDLLGARTTPVEVGSTSVDATTDTATLEVSLAALTATTAAIGKEPLEAGTVVWPTFRSRRWRYVGPVGVGVGDTADIAAGSGTVSYRIGD